MRARSGKSSTFEMPGANWVMTLTFPNSMESMDRPKVEALVTSLRGGANRLLAPYFGRRVPNGTLRGAPRLAVVVSAGAGQMMLKDCNGTLKAGDLISIGGQVVMIEADAAPASGQMTVSFSPALRAGHVVNTAIVWDSPLILWKLVQKQDAVKFPYRPGRYRPSFAIELIEDWT